MGNIDLQKIIETLETYNTWRKGADIPMPHPKDITQALEQAIKILKQLN